MSGTTSKLFSRRRSGVLCHITSLPGLHGQQGNLGAEAYHFVDFLVNAGFSVWQMLPLHPPDAHGSPYVSDSVHALSSALADNVLMHAWKWSPAEVPAEEKARWELVRAYFYSQASKADQERFAAFVKEQSHWLNDYALFRVIKRLHDDLPWCEWPKPLRQRNKAALARIEKEHAAWIDEIYLAQFATWRQWHALKHYANQHDVLMFGDMPIFVAHDSAEVWQCPDMFLLDNDGQPTHVAGVPPDYFSETGQRWGNPLYDWSHMQGDDFAWWKDRLATQFRLFDIVRIDHFRGFEAYWSIPAEDETAENGKWVKVPGKELFTSLKKHFKQLPVVAEDLGDITPEVDKLRNSFKLPGMHIIQFAFDGDPANTHLPYNYTDNSIVYTGTHDNDTIMSWYASLEEHSRGLVNDYLGEGEMPWPAIRTVLGSVACLAILPMQDVLGLGKGHRMNTPGVKEGNWAWRFEWAWLDDVCVTHLWRLNQALGRLLHP
ncbi:MAG: 4-alpha-glucanotransferase [Granulosicoccaceae bacterium]|jgi:4-alpha-glucanotransferase